MRYTLSLIIIAIVWTVIQKAALKASPEDETTLSPEEWFRRTTRAVLKAIRPPDHNEDAE